MIEGKQLLQWYQLDLKIMIGRKCDLTGRR